jgi:glyoxylase-like metal-dependent hydrolase (beta-lactamase superfamily II)
MVVAESLQRINPGLWTWHAYDPDVRTELFSTALMADAGLVIVDPIRLVERAVEELALHKPVAAIVLTNENHTRAAAWFRSRFGAPIFAHPEAMGALNVAVDGTLTPTRLVAGNLEVREIPGAAPGEIVLMHPGGGLHFGDAVIHLESTGLALLPDKYCTAPSLLKESVQRLPLEKVEVVTFAHGVALDQGGGMRLRSLLGA